MAVANRLHRSGAIDFNVEFAVRQAGVQCSSNPKAKRLFAASKGGGADQLSVCEGEPLFSAKRCKGNNYSSVDSVRNPIACLSSLNGFSLSSDDLSSTEFDTLKRNMSTCASSASDNLAVLGEMRDRFFSALRYTGISVTKFAYDRVGRQQDQFVSTLGGLNTIYVDEAVNPGDTLCVDMPFPTDDEWAVMCKSAKYDPEQKDIQRQSPGFIEYKAKKGTPKDKVVLVVRKLPSLPKYCENKDTMRKAKEFIRGFYDRGQVIGFCVTGAKARERCDLVLQANSVGGGFASIFKTQ
jgi:hypothetical protein